jgi:hypothetical protein
MLQNFLSDPKEPAPGDSIQLLGADDLPDGRYSRVQRVLAASFDGRFFEVIDRQGRHLIIRSDGEEWIDTGEEP